MPSIVVNGLLIVPIDMKFILHPVSLARLAFALHADAELADQPTDPKVDEFISHIASIPDTSDNIAQAEYPELLRYDAGLETEGFGQG